MEISRWPLRLIVSSSGSWSGSGSTIDPSVIISV